MKSLNRYASILFCLCNAAMAIVRPSFESNIPTFYEISPGTAIFVIETESVPRSSYWKKETAVSGYTGSGYLKYTGPSQSCVSQNQPEGDNHNDITGKCQGSPENWLIFRLYIETPGEYKYDIRTYHWLEDGDNDYWFHKVDAEPPIIRHGAGPVKTWNYKYTFDAVAPYQRSYWLQKGLTEFYISGRSTNCVFDRIVFCRGEQMIGAATRTTMPQSPTAPHGNTAIRRSVRTAKLNTNTSCNMFSLNGMRCGPGGVSGVVLQVLPNGMLVPSLRGSVRR